MEFDKLPTDFDVAVKDDGATDQFIESRAQNKLTCKWTWKAPYSDGVAIRSAEAFLDTQICVESNSYPSEFKFYHGGHSGFLDFSTSNAKGACLSLSYKPFCATPTPTPTATSTATPAPLPTETPCPGGYVAMDRYEVITGRDTFHVIPVTSSSTVEDFYGYGYTTTKDSRKYAARYNLLNDNSTMLLFHTDDRTDTTSVIVLLGPPTAKDVFVRSSIRLSGLPKGFEIAVEDDPVDKFSADQDNGVVVASWEWIHPHSDGVAIRMPKKDFCLTIEVLDSANVTNWDFYSGQQVVPDVSLWLHLRPFSVSVQTTIKN